MKTRQHFTIERVAQWFRDNRENWLINIDLLLSLKKITKNTVVSYDCLLCEFRTSHKLSYILYDKNGCPRCSKREKWTKGNFIKWFTENKKDCKLDPKDVPEKIGIHTKIKYTCLICGYTNIQSVNSITSKKSNCIKCSEHEPWTWERFIEWFRSNRPDDKLIETILPEKLTKDSVINYMCGKCETHKNQTLGNMVYGGCRCSTCNSYKGEKLVAQILKKLNLNFEWQWNSRNLKPRTNYKFDFALPQYKIIIEFHGSQHYIPKTFGSKSRTKEEMFAIVSSNDKKKQEIVKAAGWYWLEIPYTLKNDPATIERMIIEAIHYNNF